MMNHLSNPPHSLPDGVVRRPHWLALRLGVKLAFTMTSGLLASWELDGFPGSHLLIAALLAFLSAKGLQRAARYELRAHPRSVSTRTQLALATADSACIAGLVVLFCSDAAVNRTPGGAAAIIGLAFGLLATKPLLEAYFDLLGPPRERAWMVDAGPRLCVVGFLAAGYAHDLVADPRIVVVLALLGSIPGGLAALTAAAKEEFQ